MLQHCHNRKNIEATGNKERALCVWSGAVSSKAKSFKLGKVAFFPSASRMHQCLNPKSSQWIFSFVVAIILSVWSFHSRTRLSNFKSRADRGVKRCANRPTWLEKRTVWVQRRKNKIKRETPENISFPVLREEGKRTDYPLGIEGHLFSGSLGLRWQQWDWETEGML